MIEGFIFGFLGDDAFEIHECVFGGQNLTNLFWDAINTFQQANLFNLITQYISGIQKLITLFQILPDSLKQCGLIWNSVEKVNLRLQKYFDISNWQALLQGISGVVMLHMFDLMGLFTDAFNSMINQNFYHFGETLGKILNMIIAME